MDSASPSHCFSVLRGRSAGRLEGFLGMKQKNPLNIEVLFFWRGISNQLILIRINGNTFGVWIIAAHFSSEVDSNIE
jgi:hypothetical protein